MRTRHRTLILWAICGVVLATLLFAAPAFTASPRAVVVSEIAWMGTTVSYADEWIELYNNTGSPIDLTGWTLAAADGTPTISLSGSIPAGGYFLLERTDDTTVPGVAYDVKYTGDLGNGGEDLVLRDAGSGIVDRVDCSAGWYAGHNDAKVPMVRVDLAAEGSLAENWTYNPRCGTATNSLGEVHQCVLSETLTGTGFSYEVYFNDLATTATGITTDPTEMENRLLALIDGAQSSIDIALYGLDRQSVVDALISANGRGVTVRVVGDDDAALEYSAAYQQLVNAGIPPVLDDSGYIQHNKFLVVDSQVVWTGSTNFTDTGFTLNANNSVVITDTVMAGIYTQEFEEMWVDTYFHNDKSDNTTHLLDYNGTRVKSFFSPTDLVAFEVWGELAGADESIHFAMFYWTDPLLADRAIERMQEGVTVKGVWDQLGMANSGDQAERMCEAGAQIGTEDLPGKVHHKFAVIDVYGSDPTVILGSYNWTDSGAYQNDENTLIIHDAALAEAYYQEWERLWGTLTPERICNAPVVYLPLVEK
jgi:hypothetical protein